MPTITLTPDAIRKLKKHLDGDDPVRAAAELEAQGIGPKVIAEILGKSERTVYRLLKSGEHTLEVQLPSAGELGPEERALILSGTPAGYAAFVARYSEFGAVPAHVMPWIEAYFQFPQLLLSVAPGHLKTSYLIIWMSLYEIVCDRKVRILVISKSSDLAVQSVRTVADLLKDPRLINDWSDFAPLFKAETVWQEGIGLLQVKGGSEYTLRARGSQQQVYGFRADRIKIDDPTDQAIASSPTERDREFEYYLNAVFTRLQPNGRMLVVGQRVHPHDLYGRLGELEDEDGKVFHWQRYPAVLVWPDKDASGSWINEETARVLFPEFWGWDKLKAKLRVMGRTRFDMLYQGIPRPASGGLFSAETLALTRDKRKAFEGYREIVAKAIKLEDMGRINPVVRVLSLDPSPNAYNGITLADVIVDRQARKLEIWVLAFLRFKSHGEAESRQQQMMETLEKLTKQFKVDVVITESSSFWDWIKGSPWWKKLFDQFNPDSPRHVKQLTTKQNKYHTEYGLQSLESDCEVGLLHIPYGDKPAREMYELLEEEVTNYEAGSGKGGLDDILESLWFVKAQWRKLKQKSPGGIINNFGSGRLNAAGRALAKGGTQNRTPAQWREIARAEAEGASAWQDYLDRGVTEEDLEKEMEGVA